MNQSELIVKQLHYIMEHHNYGNRLKGWVSADSFCRNIYLSICEALNEIPESKAVIGTDVEASLCSTIELTFSYEETHKHDHCVAALCAIGDLAIIPIQKIYHGLYTAAIMEYLMYEYYRSRSTYKQKGNTLIIDGIPYPKYHGIC